MILQAFSLKIWAEISWGDASRFDLAGLQPERDGDIPT